MRMIEPEVIVLIYEVTRRKDRIEYDVTVQKSALQDGVCARVSVCMCAYAVEIKPGMLRASLMYAFGRAYGLPYKMATFIAKKGFFDTVYNH